jgi:uncharacterized SAM-binding protein YcdF (DUF218 family)/glycosyltransferase involved in cell wall biosynthesis
MIDHEDGIVREGLVCLSSIDWDFIWQQNQEIMLRFARAGTPVLFIENTGVRAPGFRDIPRIWARLGNWWRSAEGFREQAPNLIVLSPLLLPFPYSGVARRINAWLIGRSIERWMRATRRNSPILWTFLPTPLVHDIISDLAPALVVYYYTADFAASSAGARSVAESEDRLLGRADVVFVTSRALQVRALRFRAEAHYIRMGVDFESFEDVRRLAPKAPEDLAVIPHPRFVYVGGLHQWVDFEMLRAVATGHPDWHIVLIGPKQTDLQAVEVLPNVHIFGPRPFGDLPRYLVASDVGLIPYRLAKYTESVYPTKLNEYLAAGLPVVSTPLPEVAAYSKEHEGAVFLAADADGFSSAMGRALSDRDGGRGVRIAAARRNGWAQRVAEMSARMGEALAAKGDLPQSGPGILRRLVGSHSLRAVSAVMLCVYLTIFWSPLVWWLAEPLRISEPPRTADAIVLLAGGAGEAGIVGRSHEERIRRAVELYKAGFAPRILLCSGERTHFMELDVMRGIALAHGVPAADILIEERGGGTRTMVIDAVRRARDCGWRSVLLVSSSYHMRRAVKTWRKAAPEVEVIAAPVEKPRFYRPKSKGLVSAQQLRSLAQEALGLVWYWSRGWI